MRKNKLKYLLLFTILSSCTNNNLIFKQPEKVLDNISNNILEENIDNKDKNKVYSLSLEKQQKSNDLVTKPAENVDPLVTKPGENIDPEKITSVTNGQGFTNITFSQGINQVNINISLSEFKILAIESETDFVQTIDILIKMNKKSNKIVSINRDVFEYQNNLLISIKGLKDLDNLTIELIGKNKDSEIISNKEVMNESLKGNKSINDTFYKGLSKSNVNSNSNSTNNSNVNSNSNSTNNNNNNNNKENENKIKK
jgi:hypothetical protein